MIVAAHSPQKTPLALGCGKHHCQCVARQVHNVAQANEYCALLTKIIEASATRNRNLPIAARGRTGREPCYHVLLKHTIRAKGLATGLEQMEAIRSHAPEERLPYASEVVT